MSPPASRSHYDASKVHLVPTSLGKILPLDFDNEMFPLLHTDNEMIFPLHVVYEMILHDVDDNMRWDNLPTYPEDSMQPSLHYQMYVMGTPIEFGGQCDVFQGSRMKI